MKRLLLICLLASSCTSSQAIETLNEHPRPIVMVSRSNEGCQMLLRDGKGVFFLVVDCDGLLDEIAIGDTLR